MDDNEIRFLVEDARRTLLRVCALEDRIARLEREVERLRDHVIRLEENQSARGW
jgi:uncharacterized small protein (DUF1192 family)